MKYALFGDIHGSELNDLEKTLDEIAPDVLICTGDFDQTRSIRQFIYLEQKYQEKGKEVILVPGNHDNSIYTNDPIRSATIKRQGKNASELNKELLEDAISSEYIKNLLKPERFRKIISLGDSYNTIIIHGALNGNLFSYMDCPYEFMDLWLRLESEYDHGKNFKEMEKSDYKVMIRGHDHDASYTFLDPAEGIVINECEAGYSFELLKNRMHTINPGALFDGHFAIIDTGKDVPILEYRCI